MPSLTGLRVLALALITESSQTWLAPRPMTQWPNTTSWFATILHALYVFTVMQLCELCHGGENDALMLLCELCDLGFHTYCLDPPLADLPDGDWCVPNSSFLMGVSSLPQVLSQVHRRTRAVQVRLAAQHIHVAV